MTKSKLSGNSIFWGIFMFLPLFSSIIFIIKILRKYNGEIGGTLILMLFAFLFYFSVNFLKNIKYLQIKGNELKYYSILKPLGETMNISDFIGKVILTESGTRGSYKVLYLIDKQNKTSFKLMGLHYNNFEEINNAVELKKINFSHSISQYFKLLFFEKITIKNEVNSNSEMINAILSLIKLVSILGVTLFIAGSIIKNFF